MAGSEQQSSQQPTSGQAPAQAGPAVAAAPAAANGSSRSSGCPPHVLEAIYGKKMKEDKKAAYEGSLQRWWTEYADRKNDETDEYVANSLLYDRKHLPRTAPAPECVQRAAAEAAAAAAAATAAQQRPSAAAAPDSAAATQPAA
ncbi:hypothetical protein ABPG75_009701 [Micractinium tetrahymenae]